jgi:hypothetical protein
MDQLNVTEIMYTKILDMTTLLYETNGKVLAYLDIANQRMPDRAILEEVRTSVGRSNRSLTELIEELKTKVDILHNCVSCYDKMKAELTKITDFVSLFTKGDYSPEDLANLGKHVKDIEEISKSMKFIQKWGSIGVGVIFVLTTIIPNIPKFIKLFSS